MATAATQGVRRFVARRGGGGGRGFALRANSLGHLEQIDSYAPGHQVKFGSLNYVADIRGDLIFTGFETAAADPRHPDEHDLNLSSDHIQERVPVAATALEPEQIMPSETMESAACLRPFLLADSRAPCSGVSAFFGLVVAVVGVKTSRSRVGGPELCV